MSERTWTTAVESYARCKRGRREDIGNFMFRSAWEANYARFLNLLIKHGDVVRWEYEVDNFLFHNRKIKPHSYLIDFKVHYSDGRVEYHEVKGYMDGSSRLKIKLLKKYYPKVNLVVVDQKAYHGIEKWKDMIPGWESPAPKAKKP